ncbi:hypothetical protein Fmac_004205 [Flemingia macrophylla]|uniref:At3g05675-like ankyrin-like domain-containing protein n=1 Tax=Flemingia macrophylla TaxID=520843 RepID=A0ABD1N6X0_9FABA
MKRGCRKPRRRAWCCSFAVPPLSPEVKSRDIPKPTVSLPNSPHSAKSPFPIVARILSPGRVSPIDSDLAPNLPSHTFRVPSPPQEAESAADVRLKLRGRDGGSVVMEVDSEVLGANSEVFAGLIADCKRGGDGATMEVENLGVFTDTIQLMFEDEDRITKNLLNFGVYRSIHILEVSAAIMFTKGVHCCLKYLEAVPWTEEEEEKLRCLFTRFDFDEATTRDILGRLYLHDSVDSRPNVAQQLVRSISTCEDANARNQMKSLVKGLLCKSSVYEKNHLDLSKEDLYAICNSCLGSLISLFKEASNTTPPESLMKKDVSKPLIERISRQVDNINWLLEIMLDGQVAEDFVDIWAHQQQLLKMHDIASPMIRYELSRVSAILFVAMGTRKLQCPLEARSGLLQAWFGPMLLDFGWLQRCRKGLDMKALEETMGQIL